MASKKNDPIDALEIKSFPAGGFRRAGRHFTTDPVTIPCCELTDAQIEQLECEANLIVKRIQLTPDAPAE